MTKTWINAIYDRTYGDVLSTQYNPDQDSPKGCWNAVDLNRIENNTAYCAEWMLEKEIVSAPPNILPKSGGAWTGSDIPPKSEIDRIINNVKLLINLSSANPAIASQLPTIYTATQINYILANQIEYALELMHTQPTLPERYWTVTITQGVVKSVLRNTGVTETINSNTALVARGETVTIRGLPYGEDAQYQTFTNWSGSAEDIGLLTNYQSQETIFTMPYRDVSYTANFATHIARTLTIVNGYISVNNDPTAESGPSTRTYYAGDQVMIIANIAPEGKRFYEWTGTQAGLNNIVGVTNSEDPSTCILTMPDCDVTLAPHYINAGQHYVTVTNGTGSGYYDYGETVYISATVPSHYEFTNWSGDTSYLTDIYSSYQSFTMGDKDLSFTAHNAYAYSYNSIQIINGYILSNGELVTRVDNVMEGTRIRIVTDPPDNSQGLYRWTFEGPGYIESDQTFRVGDGNAIITGNYAPYRTITVNNIDNAGGTTTQRVVQGRETTIDTTKNIGNYWFSYWEENGRKYSELTSAYVSVGNNDRTFTAVYVYVSLETYTVTVINQNNSGSTVSTEVRQGNFFEVSTSVESGNYIFDGWTGSKSSSNATIGWYVTSNATITANYRAKEYYTLTVENGTGSGTYLERQAIPVTANSPSAGATFTGWTIVSGRLYQSPSGMNTTVKLGRANATIRANYSNTRQIRVIINTSDTTYSLIEDNNMHISAGTPPSGYEFNHWEITSGDATISNVYASYTTVYAHSQDSVITAIYTEIPSFTVTMEDGYVWNGSTWDENGTLPRNSTNSIKMKPAPTGYQFLQWEVYVNGVLQTDADDVYEPFAETTRLKNLTRDITVKATYYIPDPTVVYTLTIERKDGTIEQNNYAAGTDVTITASSPDTGMQFYKWIGDTTYVAGGVYNSTSYVHMPAQNITIEETYVPEGYIPEYELVMTSLYGQCCYTTTYEDPETHETITTDHWVSRWSYPEGTTVRIRTTGIPDEYYFDAWTAVNHSTNADARSIIASLALEATTLTMPNYDVDIEPNIALKTTYQLRVNDGGTSGYYYEGARADIYFNKVNTNDIHYQFLRWTGENIAQLELYDGGMFNVLTPGTQSIPQYIKMPGHTVEVTATYNTLYRLTLTNATIDSTGTSQEYYITGTTVSITANTPATGMRFQYWTGDTSRIGNIYDPTTTITTTTGTTNITAVYSTDTERNGVGYSINDLKSTSTINNSAITTISGEIGVGFILTDVNGHVYIITSVDAQNNTSTIYRMTKIVKGGNLYG